MRIGIDFDNTIANTRVLVDEYIKKYYPSKANQNFYTIDKDLERDLFTKYSEEITANEKLYEGVKEAFEYLENNNIEKYLVTNRGREFQFLIPITEKYLKDHNLHFEKLLFNNRVKGNVCINNRIDLLIDDNDRVLAEANKKGVKVLKFGNESLDFDYALTWKEVIDYIKKGL